MMSDERRRRRPSRDSSRRSRRKARRDEREYPETTLYSYPSQSQQAQPQAESPLPPITMRSSDHVRSPTAAVPMSVPIPSDLNRPQRRPRSRHGSGSTSDFTYSSSGGSSSSYLDISRWYPSFGRSGGVLNAFFKTPSERRPRRRRSNRQVKTKKTKAIFGFGNNSSSSSVNSDMAYGMGFIKKPKNRGGDFSPGYKNTTAAAVPASAREASSSRPGMQRRQTDEEILEIGRKLAQVAREQNQEDLRRLGKKPPSQFTAAASSWDRYYQSTREQSAVGRGIAPSRLDRNHGYSSDDESEWESASEDESESSDGSSGLAYGFHDSSTPKPFPERTSRPSTAIAPSVLQDHRGLERNSSVVDPRLFGPVNSLRDFVNTPRGFDDNTGAYSAADTGQERYTGSAGTAESASAEVRPLQTVYPIGTSDPGKMEAARASGSFITIQQNNYSTADSHDSTVSTPNDRPEPVPIQAPKPIAPVPSRMYDERRAHEPERSDSRERERHRRSKEYRGDRSASRDRHHQSGDYETRRNPAGSKIFAETALVGAGVAALGAALMANRDKGKSKEPEVSHDRDERYGHDDHREDDTKVQDSRRAKELALEREIERLEKALAERNKARETRKRESKRQSAPADLDKNYERERDRRRTERSSRYSDTGGDVQPESSTRVSEPRGETAVARDTDYHRADNSGDPEPQKGKMDVFQYQVSDDTFQAGTQAPPPVIIDVTPAPSPAPEQNKKSRRDWFEEEMRDTRHIVEEASHSTAPISEVEMAAAIAATEHSHRQEELEDRDRGRRSSRAEQDRVQEEANRYYHARRIAERQIRSRSRSKSPDDDGQPPRIVTPPEMKERPKVYDYSKPNADIVFDNELSPTELRFFLPMENFVRDPSAERPRPVLNLVLPTPVPTPSPEQVAHRQKSTPRAREAADEEPLSEGPTVITSPKGEIIQIVDAPEPREEVPQPSTPKSVSWGPSETNLYEVESRETSRERTPESPERASHSGKKRSSGGWGAIAAALAGATAGAAIARDDDKRSEGSRSPPKERPILPAGTSPRVMEEEPEELPPLPGPKPASTRSPQMLGAFDDDLEFTANVAAGLEHAGFPSDIVVEDPNFRRRDSPPGSNEPFAGVYTHPFAETVSDLGIMGLDDGSKPVHEPGYVLGEVADTPASEKAAAFDEPTAYETPKLSKKEQRKLEKAAKAAKLAEEEQEAARPIGGDEDEWADTSSSKKLKKSKKSKRASVSWDDEDTPVNDTAVETLGEFQATRPSHNDEDWDVPKKSKKSKRSSKSYSPTSEDSPERREHRRSAYDALEGDITSVVSDSGYNKRSSGPGRDDDRSVVSAPSSSDRKRDSKADKQSSGSGFWGLLKRSNGVDADGKESKKDNAGTLGAGAGLAGAAVAAAALAGGIAAARSDAAEAPSGQEEPHVGRDVDQSAISSLEDDVFDDPEIVPRVIKPAIDPQYGDLLPLPPSPAEKSSLDFEIDENLPALPDSRPSTPPGRERDLPRERSVSGQKRPGLNTTSHPRRLSIYEAPPRSPSHTAIPIQFRMGQRPASIISPAAGRPIGSGSPALGRSSPTPQSPVASFAQEFSPPFKKSSRPTSWENNKEYKPLYLLEQAGRSTRETEENLSESPEWTPLPPSRESPAPEMVSETGDVPLFTDMEATKAVPLGSHESTPKVTPAAERNLPPLAEDVESTPFETPFDAEAPFGISSTSSLPESSYATPVESPSLVTEQLPVSGHQEVEEYADVVDNGSQDRGRAVSESAQPQAQFLQEQQTQEASEAQQKKSYFPSALSMLPAATLAGVGALLGRAKHDEHTIGTDSEQQREDLPALADQTRGEDARDTTMEQQSGATEQGVAGARKSTTDTTYSSTTDIADASMPNDPAAAAPMRPEEESLPIGECHPRDAVPHDVDNSAVDLQTPAVVEAPDVSLPSLSTRDTETDPKTTTTPTEPEQTADDMETIIETPADTIDWPTETVLGKEEGVSDAPQIPTDDGPAVATPINEPTPGAEATIASDVVQAESEPAQVALPSGSAESGVAGSQYPEETPGPFDPPETTNVQGLIDATEERPASTENSASPTTQYDQGVSAGGTPLKSSSRRRLRSSRVMSPHGSVDEYMSSDAVQSGEDAPVSPASDLRTTGKKYKTRSLRSSRRSSVASQSSRQGDVAAEQPAQVDDGEALAAVPDVEQFRDAAEERITSTPEEVIDQPTDAQVEDVAQFFVKDAENVEEPAAREAELVMDPLPTETEPSAEASSPPILPDETQPLQPTEVAADPASQSETPVDDEWGLTSSEKRSTSLAGAPLNMPNTEIAAEKAVFAAPEIDAPQELTLATPGEHDLAQGLAAEPVVDQEHSNVQAQPVDVSANPLDSDELAETLLTAGEPPALPRDHSETQENLRPLEVEPALAKEETFEEQPAIQPTVDEPPVTTPDHRPTAQEPEPEHTTASPEAEFPVVSPKKSKKNKKKRKGNTSLDETAHSSGTATPAELEQTGQTAEAQEQFTSPVRDEGLDPALETVVDDITTVKEDPQAVEINDVPYASEPLPVDGAEPTAAITEAPAVQEQGELHKILEARDIAEQPALEPQAAESEDAQAGAGSFEPAADQSSVPESSIPTEPETAEKDAVQEPVLQLQPAEPDAKPISLDPVADEASATEVSKSVEPEQAAVDEIAQPVEFIEPSETAAEVVPTERLEEAEAPAQEESPEPVDEEEMLRHEAETAQAEEEEAELSRLQGKRKLKPKEKQRLQELKAKADARAAEAEAETTRTPPDAVESLLEAEIGEIAPDEVVVGSQSTEVTAPRSALEQTTSAIDPNSDALPEDASTTLPEQIAAPETEPESPEDAPEDPEEIARLEAEAEAIRQEELELSRLQNKKKPKKKDQKRMKTLRASAELREREAEALRRQLEEQEAAADTPEVLESTPAEAEPASSEKPPADEASDAIPVDNVDPAQLENSANPDIDAPALTQTEEQLTGELDSAGQQHVDAFGDTQPEDRIIAETEDTSGAEAEEAVPGLTDGQTATVSTEDPQAVAEETTPLPDYATGDVHDHSIDNEFEGQVSQDVAVQEAGDLPEPVVEQDQCSLPNDQLVTTESTMPQNSDPELVQDNALQLPSEPAIALPEYQLGEFPKDSHEPEAEIVAEPEDLPPTKSDEGEDLRERGIEQPLEEVTQPESPRETFEPPLETQDEDAVQLPTSEAIPTFEMQEEEAPIEALEETPAVDAAPPEPEPAFTTKKSKKDKKKKRKDTISEDSGQTSGVVTPAEASAPVADAELLPTDEPIPQFAADEVSAPADNEIETTQLAESNPSEQVEPSALPGISGVEPVVRADEPTSGAQQEDVPLNENQYTQIPAAAEDEVLPTAEPEAEQDASPQEPEFAVSTKKSKKDKKKNRKGTISEPSPQASGLVTPTGTQDTPQEPTPEVLERFEDPISTAEPEPVPTTAADALGQEQITAALEEPSTLPNEAEADAAVKEPKDPKVEELREPSYQGHEVSSPAEHASLMLTHEQPGITAQTAEDFLVDETQRPETEQASVEKEQAKSPTVLEDSSPAAPSIMAEPDAMAPPEDVGVQADEPSAGLGPAVEAPPPADEPEEVQADEFFVVPTKKSKKDKKKKRASAAWSEPESGAQTPATETPIEPVSTDMTKETTTHNRELSTASSDLPADEPAKESPAPLDDWAPASSSKKSKRDKKKKRASASLPEPESGAQTPMSEELQELPDASGQATETAEQEDADLVTQPTEFLSQGPETSSPRESTDHATDAGPAAAEESSDVPPEIPTSSVEPDSTTKKSGGGWGLIAAALGGGIPEPGEISHPTQPAEALESKNEPVALPTEDEPPVTAEVKEEESRPEAKSFDESKAPTTKSMSGWGTIAAAVAGVTAGAAAVSEDKPEREASPQGALEYVAPTSDPRAEPDPESKVIDEGEALAVAGGERAVAHDDSVSAPIPKPDLEDKIEDGEDAPIVSGGDTVREDIEPWSFEAARDIETEPSNEPELDDEVKDGGDTVMMAPSEEPTQQLQTEDNNSEAVAEPANDFLDVDRPTIRPSSPVSWEDEDRLNEYATPTESAPVLDEEGTGAASVPTSPQHAEPGPFEFVTSKKSSKKDKKKKKRGSVSESPDAGTEVTIPVTETPRFEETQELTEPVDLEGTKPVEEEAEALDWIPKRKMSKKDKRKAKKGSLSVSEPEPVVVVPDDSQQQPAELGTSPQIVVAESQDRKDHDTPADEARQDLPWTEEPEVMLEPTDEKESGLDAEASSTQQPQPVEERQPEDAVVKSPVLESALQEAPVLTRKMSKKEKRKAKKRATSSWEDDVLEPSNNTVGATEDTQSLESPDATVQPEPTRDDIEAIPSPIVTTTQPAEAESNEPVTPAAEEVMAEDEWAPLSREKSKKDKRKKGKQLALEPAFTEEQPKPDFPETFAPSPSDPPVPQMFEPSAGGQSRSIENPREIATEPLVPSSNIEHVISLAEQDQPQPSTDTVADDWEEPTERPEPTKVGLRSPAALGAELQKMPSAAPSPDIWENEDYFMPRAPNVPRDSPGDKPIENVDIHPAFSRELRASPERGSRDERPLVGLGLIHRHSSIFQDDDGYAPKLLTAGAGNFSVESLAVEEAGSSDDFFQAGKEPRSGKTVLGQRVTSAPEDYGDSHSIQRDPPQEANVFAAQHANFPEPDDGHPADSLAPRAPKPPPSPGLDDVSKMSKKGSVAALAERFGGTTKKTTGKRKKVSKYVDKRTPQDDLFDEPAMWEGSERKAVEGSRLDLDTGDFWAVGDSELDEEASAEEPDSFAGRQGATTSYGQEAKAGDDNVSATHSPTGQEAGEFTPQVPEQASRAEEVPMESLVVESPVLGSHASFEMSPREEQTAIEPLDRPPDIDTGQREEAGEEQHGLHTPRSLSPASERGVRLDTAVSPSVEADDYAMLQGISPVSDFKRSVSRRLPPVQEEPQEEKREVGKHGTGIGDVNRDSGVVTGSPHPPLSRHFDEFRQEQRDSGVHLRDYPNMSPRLLSPEPKRVSQSSLESEGAKLDDKPRRSPLVESTPVLAAQETPVTPEPQKSRRRKRYPDLGPEAAAATTLAEGAALLKSNTGISRARTPEALSLTPPLRSRRTRSGDLRSLSQSSHRSHSDLSALLQPSPSPVSAAAVDPASAIKTPGPASCSSSSSDLRRPTAPPNTSPSASSHTPLANEGRVRSKDMASVYVRHVHNPSCTYITKQLTRPPPQDGVGEGRLGSPRSPTRPHSMRRRQSMQVLELESRVEQLLAENHALSEARAQAELHSTNRATSTIADRDNEIESLKQSLNFMRKEIQRLTEVNDGLNSAIAQSAFQHEDRYRILESQHADATRELHAFRDSHSSTSQTIQEKDAEIRHLRDQLEDTKAQIRDMQRQILASKPADADFLRIKDVDYFDHRCQQLCSHVQQWVLRFSKFSDMRACRLTSELNDEKIIDRLDNAVLDGSNVDKYLNDRVRRRDIFMSLAMTMIWEFVFTRYLFGMDREQRQKLKALEKLLLEVGPPHAVRQWRAVTLTLLSRRDSFKTQRDQDTEAVVQAVFQTLSMILPPPSNLEDQIQSQLRKVMREAVDLSIEMRTQRAEYMMLPPLQPEYDANGDLAEPHPFNATLMNERAAGDKSVDNDDLQAQGAIVRVVLFPLVVKKGDDDGVGDDEVVVCPAQVMIARPRGGSHHHNRSSSSRLSATRAPSSDAGGVSLLRGGGSPSTAPNRSNVSMAEAEYFEGGI